MRMFRRIFGGGGIAIAPKIASDPALDSDDRGPLVRE
jgi:hypothetical protein